MNIKLFDSELRIMELLWKEGDKTAKEIAEAMHNQVAWSKTTTYTVLKKCIIKGAIERTDPNFVCHAIVTREQSQELETKELINKMYDGSADRLIASLLGRKNLSPLEIEKLKLLVKEME